jgi:hypothetical protein
MNLVGKILTVLILVMSLCFMTMALMVYATHRNWKEVVTKTPGGLKEQITQLQQEKDNLEAEKTKLQGDITLLTSESQAKLAQLETLANNLKTDISNLEKSEAKLKQDQRAALATLDVTQAQSGVLRADYDNTRKKESQAQADRNAHFQRVQDLTDELHNLVVKFKTAKEREMTLAADNAKVNAVLKRLGVDKNIDETATPPVLKGQIQAVRSGGLVEITLGSDDGLLKGHKLQVVRAGGGSKPAYLGSIVVIETTPERAVCRTEPKLQQGEFKNGDVVTTKLER